jgi:hypothetical protein
MMASIGRDDPWVLGVGDGEGEELGVGVSVGVVVDVEVGVGVAWSVGVGVEVVGVGVGVDVEGVGVGVEVEGVGVGVVSAVKSAVSVCPFMLVMMVSVSGLLEPLFCPLRSQWSNSYPLLGLALNWYD